MHVVNGSNYSIIRRNPVVVPLCVFLCLLFVVHSIRDPLLSNHVKVLGSRNCGGIDDDVSLLLSIPSVLF